jgi:hypothetical protein
VAPEKVAAFEALAADREVPFTRLGETGGPRMVFAEAFELTVAQAREIYESALPTLLSIRREAG